MPHTCPALSCVLPCPAQIFRQLGHLHDLGLVHGDIKLENTLVKVCPVTGQVLDVQIADWGTAVHLGGAKAKKAE
jgi:serine/threonine protein kinase